MPRKGRTPVFEFEDKLYGHNYQTDRSFVTTFELRQEIKQQYIEALNKLKTR